MKRYMVFYWFSDTVYGGMNDFVDSFDKINDAKDLIAEKVEQDFFDSNIRAQVYDLEKRGVVYVVGA